MSEIKKKRHGHGWLAWYIPLLLLELAWFITYLIHNKNIAIFDSKGMIAHQQRELLIFTSLVLLAVAIPTIALFYFTAWKYRESNTAAIHSPRAQSGKAAIAGMWLVPTITMVVIGLVMWPATHRLEPNDTIKSDKAPITIQVISLRWKWLFLYPDQKIATVNFVQIPKDTPVTFELTADETPMSSFWIPNLGGQLYSMTSHVNRLNLIGETVGDYRGSSAELNGAGFTGMKFTARVSTPEDFNRWADGVRQSHDVLDTTAYANLLKPSEDNPAAFYSAFDDSLYDKVVMKYMDGHAPHTHTANTADHEHSE